MEVEILHKICLMTALVMGNLVPQNNLFEQVVFKKPLLKLLKSKYKSHWEQKRSLWTQKCISFKIGIVADKNILDSFVVNCDNCLEIEKVTKNVQVNPFPCFSEHSLFVEGKKIVLLDCQTLNICQLYTIRPSVKIIKIRWCKKI